MRNIFTKFNGANGGINTMKFITLGTVPHRPIMPLVKAEFGKAMFKCMWWNFHICSKYRKRADLAEV